MTARLRAPGFPRAGLFLVLGTLFCAAIIIGVREAYGFPTFADGGITTKAQNAILLLSLLIAPLWFLVGLGAFDYWFYWAAGKPTRPEDHSGHGARSWRDYFRVNTDHKVIGIQYVCTTFIFFVVGGLMAMIFRAELAQPGAQFVDGQTFNGLVSMHAALMIFLFIIPAFAGLANDQFTERIHAFREGLGETFGHVLHDNHAGWKIRREHRQDLHEGLWTSRRAADRHDSLSPRHADRVRT